MNPVTRPRTITSGSPSVDEILGGGFPRGSTTLLSGGPGVGKTALAQQTVFANATEESPALYLTTVSEPLSKLVRYLERYSFYDPDRMYGAVSYRDLAASLRERPERSIADVLSELLSDKSYALLIIDSVKGLHDLISESAAFRLALFDAVARLAASDVTTLWLGEYGPDDTVRFPEFAIADGIVELYNRAHGVRNERSLRVLKMRGTAPLSGEHSFVISAAGIMAFPRLGASVQVPDQARERVPSGVDGFDALAGGGLWRGSTTYVLGPSGVGKTNFGLSFLAGGASAGEPGLMYTMQESPVDLVRVLASPARALVHIEHDPPTEADLVEVVIRIKDLLVKRKARRFVLDGVGDLRDASLDPSRLRAAIYNLGAFCRAHGIVMLVNAELVSEDEHTELALSSLTDAIIRLRYEEPVGRSLQIRKMRFSGHAEGRHPYRIDDRGFHILSNGA